MVDLSCDLGESHGNFKVGRDDDVIPFIVSASVGCASTAAIHPRCARLSTRNGVRRSGRRPPRLTRSSGLRAPEYGHQHLGPRLIALCISSARCRRCARSLASTCSTSRRMARCPTWPLSIEALLKQSLKRSCCSTLPSLYIRPGTPKSTRSRGGAASGWRSRSTSTAALMTREWRSLAIPSTLGGSADAAIQRVVSALQTGRLRTNTGRTIQWLANSICFHGDTPDTLLFATRLRAQLEAAGFSVLAPADWMPSDGGGARCRAARARGRLADSAQGNRCQSAASGVHTG